MPRRCRHDRGHLLELLPELRTKAYDARKLIEVMVDVDSVLELKPKFGRSIVTALTCIDGMTVGEIANNPMFKEGAIDVDACNKATSFLVLCFRSMCLSCCWSISPAS